MGRFLPTNSLAADTRLFMGVKEMAVSPRYLLVARLQLLPPSSNENLKVDTRETLSIMLAYNNTRSTVVFHHFPTFLKRRALIERRDEINVLIYLYIYDIYGPCGRSIILFRLGK